MNIYYITVTNVLNVLCEYGYIIVAYNLYHIVDRYII